MVHVAAACCMLHVAAACCMVHVAVLSRVACRMPRAALHVVHVARCVLHVVCYVLHVVCYMLHAARCMLHVARCVLHVVRSVWSHSGIARVRSTPRAPAQTVRARFCDGRIRATRRRRRRLQLAWPARLGPSGLDVALRQPGWSWQAEGIGGTRVLPAARAELAGGSAARGARHVAQGACAASTHKL